MATLESYVCLSFCDVKIISTTLGEKKQWGRQNIAFAMCLCTLYLSYMEFAHRTLFQSSTREWECCCWITEHFMKDKCLLMNEIKIQAWLNFNLLRLQPIANIVTIHQISAKVMFQGISGIVCYFFCLFFENVLWKYCYEEIIPPIWHKSAVRATTLPFSSGQKHLSTA